MTPAESLNPVILAANFSDEAVTDLSSQNAALAQRRWQATFGRHAANF